MLARTTLEALVNMRGHLKTLGNLENEGSS